MARVQTLQFTDDLSGQPIDAGDVRTVFWHWNGVDYEFDTTAASLDAIQADGQVSVTTLLSRSRRCAPRRRLVHRETRNGNTRSGQGAAIRQWAREHDIAVSGRGRIPFAVVDQYYESQG